MKRRTYKNPRLQLAYDSYIEAWHSKRHGWIAAACHGLWRSDGTRMRGAAGHGAFWKGFEGLTLSRGRLMYEPSSVCRMAYMAGRDCAREQDRMEREIVEGGLQK